MTISTKVAYKIESMKDGCSEYFEQKLEYKTFDEAIFWAKKLSRPSRIVKKTTTSMVVY